MVALVILIGVPILEIVVAAWVASLVGFWPMVVALVALSVLGLFLLPRVGWSAYRRVQAAVARGEKPGPEITSGALLLVAALLLLLPGFITGLVGLLLLIPPIRHAVGSWVRGRVGRSVRIVRLGYRGPAGGHDGFIDTTGHDAARQPPTGHRPELDH